MLFREKAKLWITNLENQKFCNQPILFHACERNTASVLSIDSSWINCVHLHNVDSIILVVQIEKWIYQEYLRRKCLYVVFHLFSTTRMQILTISCALLGSISNLEIFVIHFDWFIVRENSPSTKGAWQRGTLISCWKI